MSALGALVLAAAFLRPVPLRLSVSEDSAPEALAGLCRLPGAQLELHTRSNMLATGVVDALRICRRPLVRLRLPLLRAHREELAHLPGVEPLFRDAPGLLWNAVSVLGPRRLHLSVRGPLTPERAARLARFHDVVVTLDLRGRVPDAAELARFRALAGADRMVRLDSATPPAEVGGLAALALTGLQVDSSHNRLPAPLLEALARTGLPVRVTLAWPFTARQVAALAALPRLALRVRLGRVDAVPRRLSAALAPVEPDLTRPEQALPH